MAVGLSTIVHGVAERRHIQRNLDIIEDASTRRSRSSASTCRSS